MSKNVQKVMQSVSKCDFSDCDPHGHKWIFYRKLLVFLKNGHFKNVQNEKTL
jgi:hypothetical protein